MHKHTMQKEVLKRIKWFDDITQQTPDEFIKHKRLQMPRYSEQFLLEKSDGCQTY